MKRLQGRVAVITGAGSGMGRAAAVLFTREGANVVVADIDEKNGNETVDIVREEGGESTFARVDVSDAKSVEGMVSSAVERYGRIDVLYNNVGIAPVEDTVLPHEIEEETWDRVIGINLKSVFLCSKYVIPEMMKTGGGKIINTSSSAARIWDGSGFSYTASKGGVESLTRLMASRLAQFSIRVNAISPGWAKTPMNAGITMDEELKGQFDRMLLFGMQEPEDVAKVALFLASDDSNALTGAVLAVDNGFTAFKLPQIFL
jgi:NAD(P)-dependent dehydrogenase (short-subunit alcohol dehydrogenase family)